MLATPQSLSIPLQDGLRFFHYPLPPLLSAYLAARFPSSGEVWAYHVSFKHLDGLGSAYPPGGPHLRQRRTVTPVPAPLPFGSSHARNCASTLGLLSVTTFISDSHLLTDTIQP